MQAVTRTVAVLVRCTDSNVKPTIINSRACCISSLTLACPLLCHSRSRVVLLLSTEETVFFTVLTRCSSTSALCAAGIAILLHVALRSRQTTQQAYHSVRAFSTQGLQRIYNRVRSAAEQLALMYLQNVRVSLPSLHNARVALLLSLRNVRVTLLCSHGVYAMCLPVSSGSQGHHQSSDPVSRRGRSHC
jgi:hypothetical protein